MKKIIEKCIGKGRNETNNALLDYLHVSNTFARIMLSYFL